MQWVHSSNVVNHVVIGLDDALGWINRCKVDAVTVIAMNQIVMDVQIVLVVAGFVAGAAAGTAQW